MTGGNGGGCKSSFSTAEHSGAMFTVMLQSKAQPAAPGDGCGCSCSRFFAFIFRPCMRVGPYQSPLKESAIRCNRIGNTELLCHYFSREWRNHGHHGSLQTRFNDNSGPTTAKRLGTLSYSHCKGFCQNSIRVPMRCRVRWMVGG